MRTIRGVNWIVGAVVFRFFLLSNLESPAHAQVAAIQNIVGGNDSGSVADGTYGWRFTIDASASMSVTHLGLLDMHASGFLEGHRVGIWESGGDLVTELTFDAGETGTLENGFRYLPVTLPATLQAGQSYAIGSWNLGNSDNAITGASFDTEYADEIEFVGAGYFPASGFGAPTQNIGLNHGYFGPNFKFVMVEVPEPREVAALAAGGLAIFGVFRRFLGRT